MKFIFPQNYKFNSKLFGLIDIQTAVVSAIWAGIMYLIINLLFKSLYIKVCVFIITVFPVVIFSIVGVNGENIINVAIYMTKFIMRRRLLFYRK